MHVTFDPYRDYDFEEDAQMKANTRQSWLTMLLDVFLKIP